MNSTMRVLIQSTFLLTISWSLTACNDYKNESEYTVKVGETIHIYYRSNSCCNTCIIDQNKLSFVAVVDRERVDAAPADCEGCSSTDAFVIEGMEEGIESVTIVELPATESCEDPEALLRYPSTKKEHYRITVVPSSNQPTNY